MIEAAFSPTLLNEPRSPSAFAFMSSDRHNADAPVVGLAGSDLAARFRHWRGASGQRYLFSVFPLDGTGAAEHCPHYQEAVVLVVVRAADDTRRIAWMGQTGHLPGLLFDGDVLKRAIAAGANEIHMHLLAKDPAARDAILRDIAG